MDPKSSSAEQRQKTPQFLSPGNRVFLFCTGLFLALQAVFITVFIFRNMNDAEPVLNGLLGVWSGFSLLAGVTLVINSSRLSKASGSIVPISRAKLFGEPDSALNLASLCTMLQEGIALLRDEKIIYSNPALAYLLGAQEEELIDTNIRRHIHPEDLAMLNIGGSAPDAAQLTRATLRLITSLGDYRWAICNVFYVTWDGVPDTLMVFENIGPLKQAQRSLEEHEQQSRIFLERTPLGMAMFDALGQMKIANTVWYSVWNNVAGPNPKHYNILQDPFLPRADVERALRQAFGKKQSGVSNLEHATPWGETRWYNIDFHPMLTPVGNLIGVIMIQQDITDNVRSLRRENELNDQLTAIRLEYSISADRYAKLTDMLPEVLVCYDENGIVRIWNHAAEKHFELPRQNIIGLQIKTAASKLERYQPIIKKMPAVSGGSQSDFIEYENAGGQKRTEAVTVYVVGTGCNKITMLRIISREEF